MKAFLSYQFKDNVRGVVNLLHEKGIETFDSMTELETANSLQKSIKKAITECDFVFLIYTSANPNIAFEAGVAYSLNKPIFSIISEYNDIPDFLFDSPYVYATPSEIEKIEFNLSIFIKSVKPKTKAPVLKKHKYYGGGNTNFYNEIHYNYMNLNKNLERDYEILFKDILEKYQLNVIQDKFDSASNFYTDFCIWSDKLSNVIGNPILIEIKRELNTLNINQIKNSVDEILNKNIAECCLIFYDDLVGVSKSDLPNSSRYLFINIIDFIEKLNTNDFNESIRIIRNDIVHNQY